MKQKIVIRLSMNGNEQKYRTKAFKIAVSQSGVESAVITGDGKNQLEVVGEVDAATLTSLLRKNLGKADLVSVGPAGGGPAAAATAPAVAAAAMVQSQQARTIMPIRLINTQFTKLQIPMVNPIVPLCEFQFSIAYGKQSA